MKITTLLLSVTACVFAAGYVIFAPRTNDVPARAKVETPLENDADTGKPDKVAAVPQRGKQVLIPPGPQARAIEKNNDVNVGKNALKEKAIAQSPRGPKADQIESPKAASPPPPVTAKEAPKPAPAGFTVPPGHQAVVVERALEFVAGSSIKVVGSRVNVFGTTRDQDGNLESKPILRDVLVLAEDSRVDEQGAALAWLVTLAIAKGDLPVIEEARRLGPVTIVTKLYRPEEVGPPAPEAPQAPTGPVIIVTESPNPTVLINKSPNLPVIIEGPR